MCRYAGKKRRKIVCAATDILCVCVGMLVNSQVKETGGSLQQEVAKRNEGNGKEVTRARSLRLQNSICCPIWKVYSHKNTQQHTHTKPVVVNRNR